MPIFSQGPNTSGLLIDSVTREPVAYAYIMVEGKQIGTLADSGGYFKLTIPDSLSKSTLVLSSIGYYEKKISAFDLAFNSVVLLNPRIIELKDVVVTNKRVAQVVGINYKKRTGIGGLSLDKPELNKSRLFGVEIRNIDGRMGRIKNAQFYLNEYGNYKTPFRIRILNFKNGRPNDDIFYSDSLWIPAKPGWFVADLESFNIFIPDEGCLIAIELMDIGDKFYYTTSNRKGLPAQRAYGQSLGEVINYGDNQSWTKTFFDNWKEYKPCKTCSYSSINFMIKCEVY